MKKIFIILSPLIIIVAGIIFYLISGITDKFVERDYGELEKKGSVNIVTNFDPIGYFVSSDTVAGYNHDLLKALQRYTSLHFNISIENSLDKSFEGLKDGKYDIIARNIPINSNLKNDYSFTKPTVYNKLVLVQRKADYNDGVEPIRNHLKLAKKLIYIPKDSPSKLRLNNLQHEIGDTIYIKEDSIYEAGQLALMVAASEIDFTVCDSRTAETLLSKIPELDINTDIGFTHLEAWAVRTKSPVLLDSLNTWINDFKKTEEYSLILKKYYK